MVKELLPTAVALMAQVNMNEHVVFRLDRFLDERHSCLVGSSAALFHIAFCAGTNHIPPNWFAAHTPGDNVVKRQFAGWIPLAAILTPVFITSKDISAVKLYLVSRQTVIK